VAVEENIQVQHPQAQQTRAVVVVDRVGSMPRQVEQMAAAVL
jgi:hypothetical protein